MGATLSEKRGLKFQANFIFHLWGVNILSSTYNWNSVHEVYRKGIKSVTYRIFSRINLNFGKSTRHNLKISERVHDHCLHKHFLIGLQTY